MNQTPTISPEDGLTTTDVRALIVEVQAFVNRAKAENTLAAYRRDRADFARWCSVHELVPVSK